MSYLLDTNVLSETRKRQCNAGVRRWISGIDPERLHVSVITVGELGRGVARLRQRGDQEQADMFERWLDDLIDGFGSRVLSVDSRVVRGWSAQPVSRTMPTADALIAATAAVYSLTLVTRNTADFDGVGIQLVNPFDNA
ncbi:type II toxin-antitoxin system VapC family toxin [Phytoactinopolyspora mesophila]|uniref:Ribonuclease VapC n=1 Tax=Phytoactinopolyspora mesophila TaxID=2650750 RepID=A0A7K3M083_9ACTN|nr:type II toxin-antitoxin system VapC family toxin [Phytoactinopolyspora mesophila]NDL55868.1 PIN domain-containing protein [Phytoactinopolyspora mesophila]